MKPYSFRQWVVGGVILALLCNIATPLAVCRCEGCHCKKGGTQKEEHPQKCTSSSLSKPSQPSCTDEEDHDPCTPPEPSAIKGCCGLSEMPCFCQCCNVQANDVFTPKAALLVKRPDVTPSWDFVSVLPVGFANASEAFSRSVHCRTLLPPHVPLHVLLCVFLN